MSKLAEFRAAEKALQEQLAQLEALKNDVGLKEEIAFEEKLRGLMGEYGKSLRDIVAILDPQAGLHKATKTSSASKVATRRPRQMKVFKNPHTGEVVETKGGNHKTLKEWKEKWGSEAVHSWLQQ